MKIVIINNLYAPWVRGGAERIAGKIVKGLRGAGHEVFVIATAPPTPSARRVHPSQEGNFQEEVFYLPSIFYNLEKYPPLFRFFWHLGDIFNFVRVGKIKKILEEKKPDLVIAHNLQGIGLLVPHLLRKMKIRHFQTLHDIQLLHPSGLMIRGKEKAVDSPAAKIYQFISRKLMGSPEIVISPSRWLLGEHLKRGFFKKSEQVILPNYFSVKNVAQTPNLKSPIFNFKFLYVGQIEEHKGVEFLVEVFLKFLENNPAAELAIAGGGSKLEEIKKIAGGRKEIKILGRKSAEEIKELMLSSDCLIAPSLCYENSPTVIYEAVAAGLPVIGARLGGITELLEAAGGLTFEPGNPKDLAEKMELMFTHPEESDRIKIKEAAYRPADYIVGILALANGK
jgi:glycosyltransferase involved in cell wall biosynthesis